MTMTTPTWLAAGAAGWADEQLDRHGLRRTGPTEEIKSRAWSLVWRIPTSDGPVWFKANGGETRYEAALAAALARWVPGRVPNPIAIDADRGWQLTPDGGIVLREMPAAGDLGTWADMVAAYARLQRDLAGHVDEMLALGVPDHRPERLTALATALVEDPATGLSEPRRDQLRAMMARYEGWCAVLARSGVPASLNHDDLHDANVLVRPGSALSFFDWGDSALAFPFTTLLVTLRVVAYRFELPADDPQVLRVRDAYLEAYLDGAAGGPGPKLDLTGARELAQVATWTGKPGRALSWRRALATASADELAEHGDAVSGWLEELLSPGPL
jgi:hypothetical protein